ncbi:hypothetical protein SAMN05518847_102415 [Paenibacillus sp. OV219]|nr:hypothetical protein SAMN05518847_102415 [Paenibacillus sp. OV219]
MKIIIDLVDNKSTEVTISGQTFEQFCRELIKAPFYLSLSTDGSSTLFARDKIIRVYEVTE